MDKQSDFTLSSSNVHDKSYFPTPLRRWFTQLSQRIQVSEEHVSEKKEWRKSKK